MADPNDEISTPRILIVDDELDLLDELQESMLAAGWHVEVASNATMALEKLDADRDVTVLLSDIRMPGLDGLSLAKRVCEKRCCEIATEVVLLTGHGTIDDAAEAVRIGAFDFLSKPISLQALVDAAQRADQSAIRKRREEAARLAELTHLKAERAHLQAKISELGEQTDFSRGVPREFSSILSHELRTPLIALMTVPELLSHNAELPATEVTGNLGIVRDAGARLTAIADDFVELLTPPDPRFFENGNIAPNLILRRVGHLSSAAALEANQRIVENDMTCGDVETDLNALANALCRLVSNAIAWNPPGGEIMLSAYSEIEDEIIFEVVDCGPGMSETEIAIARRPFRQVDMSLARRVGGLGLGLPLAEQMAGLLGGRMRLISSVGHGTRAAIILPRRISH
jgi:signal transduction histidine kinase